MFNFNKKDAKQDPIVRGGITANYEDALKFGASFTQEQVNKVFRESAQDPRETLLNMRLGAEAFSALSKTIAFVYGKTDKQVAKDLRCIVSQ